MRRLLLALVVLLAGCSPAMTFRFVGPVTEEQRAALATDIAVWNAHTDAKHQMRVDPKGDYAVSFPESIPTKDGPDAGSEPDQMDGRECTHNGADCADAPSIRVRRGLTGARLLHVMLHELGHALGMHHLDVDGALMSGPGRAKSEQITAADIAVCKAVGACPGSTP